MSQPAGRSWADLAAAASARWPGADRAVRRWLAALRRRSAAKTPRQQLKHLGRIRRVAAKDGAPYWFLCPNRTVSWRARTFLTKEPETIEWIDTFAAGDVLFDIGANIGLYSIYAASRRIDVVAFEPESQNYALINQNIFLNGLSERIKCLALALSDANGVDYIYLSRFRAGESLHNFGDALDWQRRPFTPSFRQGSVAFSLDRFLEFQPAPFPTHIKIDVDGIEARIIRGAAHTLRDPRLKSLLVEFDGASADDRGAIAEVEAAGFRLLHKKRSPLFNTAKFPELFNYVFVRGSNHPIDAAGDRD
ncbi:MAG TPA: FkbM family methyltransferase [Vicinamibacterales bacterium]|jgi:FkbM family methyltransferase